MAAMVIALLGGAVNAPAGAYAASSGADSVVVRWNNELLEAVRNTAIGPPMVARALAVTHTCMYDAWAAYDPLAAGTRYGVLLRRPASERTPANKAEAVSYAAYQAAVDLFPARKAQFADLMESLGYDPEISSPAANSPAGVAQRACSAVLAFRHADGSNQLGDLHPGPYSDWTGYLPVNKPMVVADPINPALVIDPDRWQPLTYPDKTGTIGTPAFLGPHWGRVKPFGLVTGSMFRSPIGPARLGSVTYDAQARDVLAISAALTDRQKAIAEYWADGPKSETPPGHWSLFAQYVSHRDGHGIDEDVKMFFAMTNAVMDAGIAAWDSKRAFDSVRPITAIRYLYRGQLVRAWNGPGKDNQEIDGGTWRPYQPSWFPTPPFSEYVSGHSSFSAAAAEVLRSYTGSDTFGAATTIAAGSSMVEPGITPSSSVVLRWPTFSAAADEAGMSRRYGGIHFEQGDLDGRTLGSLVGRMAWLKAVRCFAGLCL